MGPAVRVRKPRVERGQAHLRSIAHQSEDEGRLEPRPRHRRRRAPERVESQAGAQARYTGRRDAEAKSSEQRQSDSYRAQEQIFPGRLERSPPVIEVHQRSARERRSLDSRPHQRQVLRDRHQSHRREKPEQARHEAMRRGLLVVSALEDVGHCVDRDQQKEDAGDGQKDEPCHVELQERPEADRRSSAPKGGGGRDMQQRRGKEDAETHAEIPDRERREPQGGRRENEEGQNPCHCR